MKSDNCTALPIRRRRMGEVIFVRELSPARREALAQRQREIRFRALCDPRLQARLADAYRRGLIDSPTKPKGAA